MWCRSVISSRGKVAVSSTRRNILFLVLVALLVGAAVYFIVPPAQRTKLGLDLQGGLAVILEAQDSARAPRTEEGMNKAILRCVERAREMGEEIRAEAVKVKS